MPWLRKVLYLVSGFTLASMVTTCFLDTFYCGRDVSVNWSLDAEACSTFNSKLVFRIDWAMNITTDALSELPSYLKDDAGLTLLNSLYTSFPSTPSAAAQSPTNLGLDRHILPWSDHDRCEHYSLRDNIGHPGLDQRV